MSISAVSNTSNYYQQIASGNRINSAADDAAGLAIAEKLETAKNGYDVGSDNAAAGQDLLNVADGALSSITDSLQRMRELSLQASNSALYTQDDLQAMQDEITQLKDHISYVASNTQFNTKNLLDGTTGELNLATNPDGSGTSLNMPNATLAALGIENYDVTGDFDISQLDDAITSITGARSQLGASSNALDHTISYNKLASYNHSAATSRIKDTDFAKTISELKKEEVLDQYRLMMQKKREDENGKVTQLLRFN